MARDPSEPDVESNVTGRRSGRRPLLAGIEVRDEDLEPQMGMDIVTGVIRVASVVVLLFVLLGVLGSLTGAVSATMQGASQLRGRALYVNPTSPARKQANAWQRSRPEDAARMRVIANQPQAIWLGGWMRDVRRETDGLVTQITASRAMPVLVAYNIPYRDCGLHSRGGARDGDEYRRWTLELARGIRNRPAVIILEPDAIAAIDCLPARLKDERYGTCNNGPRAGEWWPEYALELSRTAEQLGSMAAS